MNMVVFSKVLTVLLMVLPLSVTLSTNYFINTDVKTSELQHLARLTESQKQSQDSALQAMNLAKFLADFALIAKIGFVSVCIIGGEDSSNQEYQVLAKYLMLAGLPTGDCNSSRMKEKIDICKESSSTRVCHWEDWDLRIYWLIGGNFSDSTADLIGRTYNKSRGFVQQMVLGNTPPRYINAEGIMYYLANLEKISQRIFFGEVYQFLKSESIVHTEVGYWSLDSGLKLSQEPGFGPLNFEDNTLYIAVFPYMPYFMFKNQVLEDTAAAEDQTMQFKPKKLVGPYLNVTGFLVEILDIVANRLNFTYSIVLPEFEVDHLFGIGKEDNYSGLVGMLHRKEADIGLGSFIMTEGRKEALDFSVNIDFFSKVVYVRNDDSFLTFIWTTYIVGFHWGTWLGVILVTVASSIVFKIILSKEYSFKKISKSGNQECDPNQSLEDTLFMHYGCLMQQGYHTTPFSGLLRFVFWLFWFSSVCLYASYTATLTSSLTVRGDTNPFRTLEEAANKDDWEIGVVKGTPAMQQIASLNTDWSRKLLSRMASNPYLQVPSEAVGMMHIMEGNYGLFNDDSIMRFLLNGNCNIRETPISMFPTYGHLGFRKNLPFSRAIDQQLIKISGAGLLNRVRKSWWGVKIPCIEPPSFEDLGFSQMISAFAILLFGLSTSLMLLVAEVVYNRYKRRQTDISSGYRLNSSNVKGPLQAPGTK